jgi:hypothetical protein
MLENGVGCEQGLIDVILQDGACQHLGMLS